MKGSIYLLVFLSAFFVRCNKPTGQTSKYLIDSLKKAIRDSIVQAQTAKNSEGTVQTPWQIGKFKDEFGDQTNQSFVSTKLEGRFSNAATSNSPLFVHVLLTKNDGAIFLHEYQPGSPAQGFESVQLQMKNTSDEKEYIAVLWKMDTKWRNKD
jgi:hypothetical protein